MKRLFWLLFFPLIMWAAPPVQFKTQITFRGESLVAVKSIMHTFSSLGYRLDIGTFSTDKGSGVLQGTVSGIKPFSPEVFTENLKEEGLVINTIRVERGTLVLNVNAEKGVWTAPLIGRDEGVELQKSAASQWFRVEEDQAIRIQPPYGSKWYPEIAVLGSTMEVLYSSRAGKPEEQIEISLPPGAAFLKVSNTNGMKVLPGGMWIESLSPGR